jgi:hypothetical protein
MSEPAKLPQLRRARQLTYGQRNIKMLRPICDTCTSGANVPRDWYLTCQHDPYVGVREARRQVPIYEDAESGEKVVTGVEERVSFAPWPNWTEATVSKRVNSGAGEDKARAKGFIRPTELRSEAWPDGIAECCEFRGCYWQEGLKETRFGKFCRTLEAKLVGFDETGRTIEIGWNQESTEKRYTMLDSMAV